MAVFDEHALQQQSSQRELTAAGAVVVPGYPVEPEESEGLPLTEYWRIFRRRQFTILSILILTVTTVMIGTLRQPRVYEAKLVLQIDREAQNVLSFKDMGQVDLNDEAYLETIYQNLKSRTLARRVVENLHLLKLPQFGGGDGKPGQGASSESQPANAASDEERMSRAVSGVLGALSIAPVRRSRLVEIRFESTDPVLAMKVANSVGRSFIEQSREAKYQSTIEASEWLSQQLVGMQAQLEKAEEDLQRYSIENNIVLLDDKQTLVSERLKQLQEELSKAEADVMQKQALSEQADKGEALGDNAAYQGLKGKLLDLRREYAEASAMYEPIHPKAMRLLRQIEETEKAAEKERLAAIRRVADELQAARTRQRLVKQAYDQQTREFNSVGEKSITYNILKRKTDTIRQLHESLLQKLKEADLSATLKATNLRIVDGAEVPRTPIKPRKITALGLAVALGLGLGVGLAFFQEYLDDSLKTPDDVQHYLRLPPLAVIPAGRLTSKSGYGYGQAGRYGTAAYGYAPKSLPAGPQTGDNANLLPTRLSTTYLQAEAYRSLRTSVLLSTSGNPPRIILVTSAAPGEGKSTIVVNLGIVLAQLGGPVLIIDSDMRRPRLNFILKAKTGQIGLSTYLSGQVSAEDVISETPIPNLHAVFCGPRPSNPAELLSSPQFAKLLRDAREKFHYIVLDSPPVMFVADARVLAPQVEACVLVAQGGKTPRKAASQAKRQLLQVNTNIIGVVLNNVDFAKTAPDYYERYYNYEGSYGHYRYSYGQAAGETSSKDDDAAPGVSA